MRVVTRLAIGLGVAAVVATGLHFALVAADAAAVAERQRPPPPPDLAIPDGRSALIYLAHARELPAAIEPVIEIKSDGQVRLDRPPPPPEGPDSPPAWLASGIILPVRELSELDPRARRALCAAIAVWSPETVPPPGRIAPWGVQFEAHELRGMLAWLR